MISEQWLEEKFEDIKKMNDEIEKRMEQLRQQQLMNVGAVAMINELRKELNTESTEA